MRHLFLTLAACAALAAQAAPVDVAAEQADAATSLATQQALWPDATCLAQVELPNIDNRGDINVAGLTPNTYELTDCAIPKTDDIRAQGNANTALIQAAIDQASQQGGGRVVIPAGCYFVNALTMKSKVCIHLSAGCTLRMLPYGLYKTDGSPLFSARSVDDVIIEGEGNTSLLYGDGYEWWYQSREAPGADSDLKRPGFIRLSGGKRHLFRNFMMQNSPATNLTLGQSGNASHMTVHDITISNPSSIITYAGGFGPGKNPSHNTDGIPVWGPYVNIYNCVISTGDDNIVCDANTYGIHAWNITCGTGHGMSIGSYTSNTHHILYEGVKFYNTETCFRIKTDRDRSGNDYVGQNGAVSNIVCQNSEMWPKFSIDPLTKKISTAKEGNKMTQIIFVSARYDDNAKAAAANPDSDTPRTITATTPQYRDFLFKDISLAGAVAGSKNKDNFVYVYACPELPARGIVFDNVRYTAKSGKADARGIFLANAEVTFQNNCNITTSAAADIDTKYKSCYTGQYRPGAPADTDDATVLNNYEDYLPAAPDPTPQPGAATTVELSWDTYNEGASDAATYTFPGGYTITNTAGKAASKGITATKAIKYSKNVEYVINIPKDLAVTQAVFYGYSNVDGAEANLGTVAGLDCTAMVLPARNADPSTATHTITFPQPVTDTLPFRPAANQVGLAITLTVQQATAIDAINDTTATAAPRKYLDRNGLHIGRYNALGQRER